MPRRARKRREGAPASRPPRPGGPEQRASNGRETMARGYARAREKDEEARAALVPLAPGERPWPIVVSAILAVVVAVANVVLVLTGWDADGQSAAGPLVFAAVMLVAAAGMWKLRYWAVLGFEVLLGVSFIFAILALLRAGNAEAVLQCVVAIAITGPLFYLLIRQMARIQMPTRK